MALAGRFAKCVALRVLLGLSNSLLDYVCKKRLGDRRFRFRGIKSNCLPRRCQVPPHKLQLYELRFECRRIFPFACIVHSPLDSAVRSMASVFSGEINRHWEFLDSAGGRHVLSLIHDCVSGARACLLDYAELKDSAGTSNCLNLLFGAAKIAFEVKATGEWGKLEIRRSGILGYQYRCEVDGRAIRETTSKVNNQEHEFDVRIPSSVQACAYKGGDQPNVTWYLLRVRRLRDGACTEVHRRYTDFEMLHQQCDGMMKGHHLSDSLPPLPCKSPLLDRSDAAFIESRRAELQAYLRTLLRVPHVGGLDTTRAFLGLVGDLRERSFVVSGGAAGGGGAGFALTADVQGDGLSDPHGFLTVAQLLRGAPAGVAVGDMLLRVGGATIEGKSLLQVTERLEKMPQPYLVHLISAVRIERQQRQKDIIRQQQLLHKQQQLQQQQLQQQLQQQQLQQQYQPETYQPPVTHSGGQHGAMWMDSTISSDENGDWIGDAPLLVREKGQATYLKPPPSLPHLPLDIAQYQPPPKPLLQYQPPSRFPPPAQYIAQYIPPAPEAQYMPPVPEAVQPFSFPVQSLQPRAVAAPPVWLQSSVQRAEPAYGRNAVYETEDEDNPFA
ncbi:hypothetical protein JKP88DRAFT_265419 [Tribonema minus]|uniref:PX domain-containing protein n=1 Tax=Tribonema minus TaxID=303371 RepID=A0A835YSM5_9STRA|nr:hypothetical protein JKP88DRAFT_265419 [Tribonema minus]